MNVVKFKPKTRILECSACGAEGSATCDCGAPYIAAGARAAAAVAANPGKSDRLIATEIGVNQSTVSRARNKTTDASAAVRVGKDGKKRKLPTKPDAEDDDCPECATPAEATRLGFLNAARTAVEYATLHDLADVVVDQEMVGAAREAASAWTKRAAELTRRLQ